MLTGHRQPENAPSRAKDAKLVENDRNEVEHRAEKGNKLAIALRSTQQTLHSLAIFLSRIKLQLCLKS